MQRVPDNGKGWATLAVAGATGSACEAGEALAAPPKQCAHMRERASEATLPLAAPWKGLPAGG